MHVTIEVLVHNNDKQINERDAMIQGLMEHNNKLEDEAERWRRAMDSANGESHHLRAVIESKKREIDEFVLKNKELMGQLVAIQTANDELTIVNRTMQSELKDNEPTMPIPKIVP